MTTLAMENDDIRFGKKQFIRFILKFKTFPTQKGRYFEKYLYIYIYQYIYHIDSAC